MFVSRKAIAEDVWGHLLDWWLSAKNSHTPLILKLKCQMHKKGTNNWRAIEVQEDESQPLSALPSARTEAAPAAEDNAESKVDSGADPMAVYRNLLAGKQIGGDWHPKYGHVCRITSSGKNFSFADDCIFIRNELRDACGIKGLWVGDVVTG